MILIWFSLRQNTAEFFLKMEWLKNEQVKKLRQG